MIRNRIAALAATAVAASLLLTACNATDEAASAAKDGVGTALQSLHFNSGTAKQNHAPAKTGDWAVAAGNPPAAPAPQKLVQRGAGKAGDLDPGRVNPA
ncbi:hypothetical protein ABT075_40660, partial [Streptomyces sp. NPDC002677]